MQGAVIGHGDDSANPAFPARFPTLEALDKACRSDANAAAGGGLEGGPRRPRVCDSGDRPERAGAALGWQI